jgi:hypothetical protein
MYKILLALCLAITSLHSADKKELSLTSHKRQQQPIDLVPLETFFETHSDLVPNKSFATSNYLDFKKEFNPITGRIPINTFMVFVGHCNALFLTLTTRHFL